MKRTFGVIAASILLAAPAAAEEITVLDDHGLIRFRKVTATPIAVDLRFECDPLILERPAVLFRREDGLLDDRTLIWSGPCDIEVRNLSPGRWKVTTAPGESKSKALPLLEVREIPAR